MNKNTTNEVPLIVIVAGICIPTGIFVAFDQSGWLGMSAIQNF